MFKVDSFPDLFGALKLMITRNNTRRAFASERSCKIWAGVIIIIVVIIVMIVPGGKQRSILLRRLRPKCYFVGFAQNATL